jgi:MoaA/NifB/PqqE/SkfB family radical SAM enzyme
LMTQAYELGCRKIQFIGGEPQLNPEFKRLLRYSADKGFEFVEVFTNLTKLDDETLELAVRNQVHFATSVYSDDPAVHDAVTTVRGSHKRTIGNLRRLIAAGVRTRAAVISMDGDGDDEATDRTRRFLLDLGTNLGSNASRSSGVREFGRGRDIVGKSESLGGLCGHCWNGSLAIAPDGSVMPCVMARQWPVGDVLERPLAEVLHGDALLQVRREIYDDVWRPKVEDNCAPYCYQLCGPDESCPCDPLMCPQSCTPWGPPPVVEE